MKYKFLLDILNWLVCIFILGPWLVSSSNSLLVILGFSIAISSTIMVTYGAYVILFKGE